MNNKEDREWVLENVEIITADVKDIDELCCALEHSTIFATEYIQTFATNLIKLEYDNKNLQQEIDRYKNIIDELEKAYYKMEEKQVEIDGRGYYYTDLIPIEEIIDKLKELKGE